MLSTQAGTAFERRKRKVASGETLCACACAHREGSSHGGGGCGGALCERGGRHMVPGEVIGFDG